MQVGQQRVHRKSFVPLVRISCIVFKTESDQKPVNVWVHGLDQEFDESNDIFNK